MDGPLSEGAGVEEVLGRASAMEREYEWLQASDLYRQVLSGVDEGDYFKRGDVQERIGLCLHRAAMQVESREGFLEGMRGAVKAYEVARGLFERSGDENAAWVLRCGALSKYLSHWIESNPSEKLGLLSECHGLERGALDSFWDNGDKLEYCRTYNELAQASELLFFREWDQQLRKEVLEERLSWGERSISVLLELDDSHAATRAHLAYFKDLARFNRYFEPTFQLDDGMQSRVIQHVHEAFKYADEVGDDYTTGLCYIHLEGDRISDYSKRRLNYLKKALEHGEKTRDIYLKAVVLGFLAYGTYWRAFTTEDPDKRIETADEAMEFYDKAQNLLKLLSFQMPVGGKICRPMPGGYAEYYLDKAVWETSPEKKLELLEESEKDGLKALKAAKDLGIPLSISGVSHILSRTLTSRARLETDLETKRGLLIRAGEHRERSIEIMERLGTFWYWNHGIFHYYLAKIKEELALIEPDPNVKVKLLEDARSRGQKGLDLIYKVLPLIEKWGGIGNLALSSRYQDGHGATLTRLYELTKNREHLRGAIKTWQMAIETARKVPMFGRIAESYWKIAKTLDTLGEHSDAAENFELASESYLKAAEDIPQLKGFYQDYAAYMKAWSEIERAKQSHAEKRYAQAREHYEKAAEIHKSTERWSYLTQNYIAWARIEEAEGLSRKEQTEEAKNLFQEATRLFEEANASISIKLEATPDEEERGLLANLVQASDTRRDYCLGRAALEEARTLDRQGDHMASSRSYGSAVGLFQGAVGTSEETKRELRPLICLCEAWQRMTQAEAEASPDLYLEASRLFEEAKAHSPDERTKRLALGHSRFCMALEAGARFEDTRDPAFHSDAIRHLESAASHYTRAGFSSASEYAKATQRLFDAYIYMDNANRERDPQKRARYYMMAERVLETSAGSYLTARHPEKSEEVQRVLRRVREERELAASLSEVMHASTVVSTTETFTAPTPTREEAVGLERFESADVQANLIIRSREVKVGEDLDIEIEMVNAGRAPAQLIKVEEIIPEGFEVRSAPDICRVEDSYIDLKGRTLSPLKTQELKLVLKPLSKGTFHLKPRVLYLDEVGKYKHHEPEPATITVSELGIKGWLRGPTR